VPDWRGEVAGTLQAWLAAIESTDGHPHRRPLGPAVPTGDGWFTVDLRGATTGPDELDALRLVGAHAEGGEGTDAPTFGVIEAVHEGGRLRVRAGAHVAWVPGLVLTTHTGPPGRLVHSLRERIRRLSGTGLAAELAAGRTAGAPAALDQEPEGLSDGRREAYAACLSPGLRLVWAPPGTGATTVLARAAGDLVAAGRRVLLVSGVNRAVDDALEAVLASGAGFEPGGPTLTSGSPSPAWWPGATPPSRPSGSRSSGGC